MELRDGSVTIDAVTKSFVGKTALESFSLEVEDGEFVSLLGPSGCGKTTLLRILAGFEFPDSGRVLFANRDVTRLPAQKRPANLVFQRVTLFPHLNVFDNVAFGLRVDRLPKREVGPRIARALELVRLPDFERRDGRTLSGGEAQRVALARALVKQPRVLLLDEPLSALDLQIRRELQVELKEIHRELGTTFIYVTHDQEEAMSMSSRVVLMRDGRIVQIGTPLEIYRQPATEFAAQFVGTSNMWPGRVTSAQGGSATVDASGMSLQIANAPELAVGEQVSVLVRPEAVELESAGGTTGLVAGHVADVRFVGSVVHYRIDTPATVLLVTRPATSAEVFAEGAPVVARWRPEDVLVLRDDRNGWSGDE